MDGSVRGPRRTFRSPMTGTTLEFWAEGGMVYLEDQGDGEFRSWTQDEAKEHFRVIGQAYAKVDIFATDDSYFRTLRPEYRTLLLDLQDVLKEAHNQGDPMAHVVVERKKAADLRTELAQYQQHAGTVINEAAGIVAHPDADKRAFRAANGALQLKRGGGRSVTRRHF